MTNEKRLETILRAIRMNWNEEAGPKFDEVKKDPEKWLSLSFLHEGNRAMLELYAEALNAVETKKTASGIVPALKRILKDGGDQMNGASPSGEYWVLSSRNYGVMMNRRPENIPEHNEKQTGAMSAYGDSVRNIIEQTEKTAMDEIALPSIADVKKWTAEYKATSNEPARTRYRGGNYCYNIPGTSVWVDPERFTNMLVLFPGGIAKINPSTPYSPIIFTASDPDALCQKGILMPVRHTSRNETKTA